MNKYPKGYKRSFKSDVRQFARSATDYYPFGMVARSYTSPEEYRYGFNGQERETELDESTTSAEYWMYDGRLGRRWNVDPMYKFWESPYACYYNNPLVFKDPNGLTGVPAKHEVKQGDTYWALAKNSNGAYTVDDLKKWNPGIDPLNLKVGSKINISDPNEALEIGGSVSQAGQGSDFQSGKDGTLTINARGKQISIVQNYQNYTNEQLLSELVDALTDGTFGDQDDEAQMLAAHFSGNTGDDYIFSKSTADLMSGTQTFKNLQSNIDQLFRAQMVLNNGNYSNINLIVGDLPNFTANQSVSLKTLVGGTQQLDIWLTSISYGNNNTYTAELVFTLYDDFGLSNGDITNASFAAQFGMEGLKSMWVLQHQRGYKPFRTKASFKMTIKGTY